MKKHRKDVLTREDLLQPPEQTEASGETKKKARIIGEIKEKRERNVKNFLKDDLTFEAAIYNEAVHYYSEGKWKDVDNSMTDGKDEAGNDVLENKDNDIKVKIAKKANSKKLVTIKKDKYQIAWDIDNTAGSNAVIKEKPLLRHINNTKSKTHIKHINKKLKNRQTANEAIQAENQLIQKENLEKQTVKNLSSTIEFSDVYPNTNLQYTINSNNLKERIIIKDRVSNPVYTFRMEVKNLVPVIQENYSIIFYDYKDTTLVIFKIDPPFMNDAKGELSKDIKVTLVQDNNGYTLTWTPNNDWLQDKSRIYPVTIDPTITTSTASADIMDSFISESNPNGTAAGYDYLRVGRDTGGRYISFIKFTLPTSSLTAADFITNANLYLTEFTSSNYTSLQINAYKVLQSWSSGSVTWNYQPSINEAVIEDYQILTIGAGQSFYLDITSLVKSWFLSGNNYGVALKGDDSSTGYAEFASSDYNNNSARPLIAINYVNNSGLESYWTYHSQDVHRAGTGYVNDYNGNLVFVHNDISMSGSKMPLTLNHVFNSSERDKNAFSVADPTTGNYGYGWRLNLSQKVESLSIGTSQYYVYTDEDGTKHYFLYDSSTNTYSQQMGTDLTFTKNSDGTSSIKDKSGGVLEFTDTGYLQKIKDKNDNKITLSYDGAILKQITDGAGRVTTLEVSSIGYLLSITEPSVRKTTFSYNGAELEKIIYADGNYSKFMYDSNNNLMEAVNYDQNNNLIYKIKYTYTTQKPYRVIKVEEFGLSGAVGGSLDISYENNMTTLKDAKGRTNFYLFNDYGNTICIRGDNGGAEYYKYMKDTDPSKPNLSNKLSLESKLQKFKKNYLKNHNVEVVNQQWSLDTWETTVGYTPTGQFTTETSYMGNYSLKVARTIKSSRDHYLQKVTLIPGKTYVFSGYIKTNDISNDNGKGAAIYVTYEFGQQEWLTVESTKVNGTNDWERYEVTFTLRDDAVADQVYVQAGIIMESGTAYFDCLQLESGSIASRYNLVENADLSYTNPPVNNQVLPVSWTMNSAIETADTIEYKDGVNGFRVKGSTSKAKYMYQPINVSGKAGDTLVMSALGKSGSVPLDKTIDTRRRFSIELGLTKQGYSYPTEWHIVYFNEAVIDWQYISDVIVAQNDYISVTIYAEYYYNANYSYFTQFGLYKDEFGTSYIYDDKGNVVQVDDLAKQKSTFEYNENNDLMKATMPSNGVFKYEYDPERKRNINKATSATNVIYTFSYDSSGNPLKSRVGDTSDVPPSDAKLFMESTGSYSISGNYLKALIDNEENSVISHYDEVKGVLTATTDGKGSKTSYGYDNMDRIVSVSKRLENAGSRNIEKFPLATNTTGSKGTKPLVGDPSLNRSDDTRGFKESFNTNLFSKDLTNGWMIEEWNDLTAAYQLVTLKDTLLEEKQVTLSAYAKRIGEENPELGIQCFNKNGGEIKNTYEIYEKITPENQWVKVSHTFTVPAGTKSFFVILGGQIKGSNKIRFKSVKLQENYPFSTFGSGSRSSASFLYDLGLDKKSGTMCVWFNTTGTGTRMIFSNENSTALFNLYTGSDNKIVLNSLTKAGAAQNIITVNDITIANNQWYFVALKWQMSQVSSTTSALNCTLYVNNNTYTGSVSDFRDFTGVITAIGSNVYGNYNITGAVDNFAYSRNALGYSDIQSLYNKTLLDDQGTTVTNSYTYENDRIKTVYHNEFSYSFEYDSLGNNNKVLVGSQELITNSFEASTGNLLKSVYGNKQGVSIDYDNLDRITSRKFSQDATLANPIYEERYTYEYNSEGNLGYHEDKINKKGYRYTYGLADRLVKIDEINNDIMSSNYKNIDYTKFGYDSSNNQSVVTEKIDNKIYETRYAFDKDSKPVGVFYDPAAEDSTNFEYFHLSENSTGSKGTMPETQTPVFIKDANGEGALYAYQGTKVIYNLRHWENSNNLGISKTSGTMTVWMNTANNTGSRMIIGNEGAGKLFNVYVDQNQKVNLAILDGSGTFTNIITTEETISYNAWYFVAVSWQYDSSISQLTCRLYLNSKKYEKTINSSNFKDFTGAKTAIGSNISGAYSLNGLIRKFNYSPYFLIESEILSMYANKSVKYLYDKLGRVTKKTLNIGLTSFETQYSYVSVTGKEQGATINKLSSIQNGLIPINYQYDANGNITRIYENVKEILYYYNELNELIRENNQILNKTILYSYDAGGNIKTKTEYNYTTATNPSNPIGTYNYQYDDSNWKDKLTSYNGKAITYDEIGNPKTYDGYTYTWEEGRRLVSIVGNSKNITFRYNDSGIKTEKKVGGIVTKYHLIGDRVTYEYTDQDRIYYRYDHANDLVSMKLSTKNVDGSWTLGVEYYYVRNGQGDIIGLLDSNGIQVVSYIYDSWGKVISIGGDLKDTVGVKNPYRYRGYRYEKDTESQPGKGDGLYYLNSRYYNPEWGRFINGDGLVGELGNLLGHNMFSYCKNNYVNMKDPSGCWPTWSSILNAGKNLVNSIVETVKEAIVKISFIATTIVTFAAKNPDIAQAIIIPAASRGLKRASKSFGKSFPSEKAAKKAALRDAGIGKHGQSTPINDIYLNEGSRHPFKGTKQIRQGWVGEKGHEVFHDAWGHKEEPFDMPHFNVYFKDERTGHYYYPSNWDPNNNR